MIQATGGNINFNDGNKRMAIRNPNKQTIFLLLTFELLQRKQSNRAIKYYRSAMRHNPQSASFWNNIGVALCQASYYDQAIYSYRKVLDINPQSTAVLRNFGNVLLLTNNIHKAIPFFRKAIEAYPQQPENYFQLGCALDKTKQYNEAIEYWRKAIQLRPNYWLALGNIGVVLQQTNIVEALKCFKNSLIINPIEERALSRIGRILRTTNRLNKAATFAKKTISIYPNSWRAFLDMGNIHLQENNNSQAIKQYGKTLELNPKCSQALNNMGVVFHRIKHYDKAVQYFRSALEIDPKHSDALFHIAEIYSVTDKYDEAIQYYRKAIELNPHHDDAIVCLGNVFCLKNKFKQAIKCYRSVGKNNLNDERFWNNLGVAFRKINQHSSAIDCCKKALLINPIYADTWMNMGTVLKDIERYDKSIRFYGKALQLNKRDQSIFNNLGAALYKMNNFEYALRCYNKALQINPNYSPTFCNIGIYFAQRDDYEQAIQYYKRALESNPQYSDAWQNLGRALQRVENYAQAIQCFKRAIEIDPKNFGSLINLGIVLTDKRQYQLVIHAYTKLLEIDSISSDIVPYGAILNLLLARQKDQASSKLLSLLQKDKYASRFIQQLTDVYFHGNKWRRDLNLFIDQIFIRQKDENVLQSLHLQYLTVAKTSALFSYFISLVEFFPWNQSLEHLRVTALSLILKDISLVFYLKFFHSLLPSQISRRLKEKILKEIFTFGNIGKFQSRQLLLMSLFFFNPGQVAISNLFLQLCCLQLCYDFQGENFIQLLDEVEQIFAGSGLEFLEDKLNYLLLGQVKKEYALYRQLTLKDVLSIFKTSQVVEFSEENLFQLQCCSASRVQVYIKHITLLLFESVEKKFNKKRDAERIIIFLLKEMNSHLESTKNAEIIKSSISEQNQDRVRNTIFATKFLINFVVTSSQKTKISNKRKQLLKNETNQSQRRKNKRKQLNKKQDMYLSEYIQNLDQWVLEQIHLLLIGRSDQIKQKKHQTGKYSEKIKILALEKELLAKLRTAKYKYLKLTREGRKSKKRKLLKLLLDFGFARQFEDGKNLLLQSQSGFVGKCISAVRKSTGQILSMFDFYRILKGGDKMRPAMKKMALEMKEKNMYLASQKAIFKFHHWNDWQVVAFHKYYSQLADIREVLQHPLEKQFRGKIYQPPEPPLIFQIFYSQLYMQVQGSEKQSQQSDEENSSMSSQDSSERSIDNGSSYSSDLFSGHTNNQAKYFELKLKPRQKKQRKKFLRQFNGLFFNNFVHLVKFLSENRYGLSYIAPHYFDPDQTVISPATQRYRQFQLKVLEGQDIRLKEESVGSVLEVLASLAKGILQLQRVGIYHLDLTMRQILQFKNKARREFRIIGFDWAIKVNDSISSQPLEQTRNLIKEWLRYKESGQLQSLLLSNIFKYIYDEPAKLEDVLEVKRRTNCSEEEKVDKVIQQLEKYMFYSHKKQLFQVVDILFHVEIFREFHESEQNKELIKEVKKAAKNISEVKQENAKGYEHFLEVVEGAIQEVIRSK